MARGRIVLAPEAVPIAPRTTAPVLPAWASAANDVMRDPFGAPLRAASEPTAEDRLRMEAARLEADRRALDGERAQLKALRGRYAECIGQLAAATEQQARPQPEAIVDLALMVAKELFGRAVAADRKVLVDAVAAELAPLCENERIEVRLPAADAAELKASHPALLERVRVIVDGTLEAGDCIIESATCIIDRTLAPRLGAVRAALATALDGVAAFAASSAANVAVNDAGNVAANDNAVEAA